MTSRHFPPSLPQTYLAARRAAASSRATLAGRPNLARLRTEYWLVPIEFTLQKCR